MGARGQQRTQSRGGRRHPSLGRKGGNYHRGIVVAWAGTAGRVAAVGGRGRYEPQLPQPGGRTAGVGGRPWIALPDGAHIHRLGFGCVCWGPLSKSKFRQLDELQGSWRLSGWRGAQPGGRGHQSSSPDLASGMRHGGPRPTTWGRLIRALSKT